MSFDELRQRFPELEPISSPPGLLGTINGCGFGLYGSRDFDAETNTYVKSYAFCLIFIPIFFLRAYRVASAGHNAFYFIGREPLSSVAWTWNVAVVLAVAGFGGTMMWQAHTSSPDYIAAQQVAEADDLLAEGKLLEAASLYRNVAMGITSSSGEATEKFRALFDGDLAGISGSDAVRLIGVAIEMQQAGRLGTPEQLYERGRQIAEQLGKQNLKDGLAVFDALAPIAPDAAAHAKLREPLLEKAVAAQPGDAELLSELALIYEQREEFERCQKLLEPQLANLAGHEGARILGQIYSRDDRFDDAHALLGPYVEKRLEALHAAEQTFNTTLQQAQEQVVRELQQGAASEDWYQRYKNADEATQDEMLANFVNDRVQNRDDLKQNREALIEAAKVVPVALDLGIVQLRRAQALDDPAQRSRELEQAEKTFLAIRGVAGESDEYRLFLGQVYYWLGKHDEGKKLFDQLLTANQRNPKTLLGVGQLLREVGASGEAGALFEEAYNNSSDQHDKQQAAGLRALTSNDIDERIVWLKRSSQGDPGTKASLLMAQGQKEISEGNEQAAIQFLRESIDTYASLPESTSSLNNGALAYFAMFRINRDPADSAKGMEMLEKALSLSPSDSIMLGNAADAVLDVSLRELVGKTIDFSALKQGGEIWLIPFTYQDEAQRQAMIAQLKSHPGIQKARSYLERLLVLAPKQDETYGTLLQLMTYTEDRAGIERLQTQLDTAALDPQVLAQTSLEIYAGARDKDIQRLVPVACKPLKKYCTLPAGQRDPATYAVAVQLLARMETALAMTGQHVDVRQAVTRAEAAYAGFPSSGARSVLARALANQAHDTFRKQSVEYDVLAKKYARTMEGYELIWLAYHDPGPRGEAVRALPEFARLEELEAEGRRAFPTTCSIWRWRAQRDLHPEQASAEAVQLKQDPTERLFCELSHRLSPASSRYAFERAWWYELDGQPDQAAQALEATVKLGVAVPVELR